MDSKLAFRDFNLELISWRLVDSAFDLLRSLKPNEINALSEERDTLEVWRSLYILFYAIKSHYSFYQTDLPTIFRMKWTAYCQYKLQVPHHKQMRNELIRLEEIHGAAVQERYTPEIWEKLSLKSH